MPRLPVTDGRLLLAIATLICVGVFLNGIRFRRMRQAPRGMSMPIERINRIGLLHMCVAPIFLLVFALIIFGVLGPVANIRTIGS